MLVEYVLLQRKTDNFALAKTTGIYLAIIIIPIVFYFILRSPESALRILGPNYVRPASPSSPTWNLDADMNGDDTVDGRDLVLVARNFGK
jgi:hypothetical protein